jgi:hypothetical protein
MPNQLQEAYEDLKALSFAAQALPEDQTILAAYAVASQRMQQAAANYYNSAVGAQRSGGQPQVRPPMHRPPGISDDRQKPYSRMDVRPPSGGVAPGVALPIAPLNTSGPAPAPVQRVPAQGNVPTAPGLPDAVVPQNAQLHPRTVARMQAASAAPQAGADGSVALPAPPPSAEGDLPGIPMMDPPPGSLPPVVPGASPTR